jgi:hypothetical protein
MYIFVSFVLTGNSVKSDHWQAPQWREISIQMDTVSLLARRRQSSHAALQLFQVYACSHETFQSVGENSSDDRSDHCLLYYKK